MKAILTTLTPVHIGNGISLNKGIDFIQHKDQVGIISPEKVLSLIGKESLPTWTAMIESYDPLHPQNKQPLLDLIMPMTRNDFKISQLSSRVCKLKSKNNRSSSLKEQYRTTIAGPCIPGSSIKGSIRTALLNDSSGYEDFNFSPADVDSWQMADDKAFGPNANEKSTRFLKIGDAHFNGTETEVHEIRILNIVGNRWLFKEGQHYLAEVIPAGATAEFRLKIDEELLKRNLEKYEGKWTDNKTLEYLNQGYPELCRVVSNTTKELLEWEIEVLDEMDMPDEGYEMLDHYKNIRNEMDSLRQNEFITRIGGNSGWIFTTAGWWRRYSEDIPESKWIQLRKNIQRRDYGDMETWPKTRKITAEGDLLGFVKVSLTI